VGHAEDQGDLQPPGRRHRARPQGGSGALQLYLDFINLFMFLLRFLGDRR